MAGEKLRGIRKLAVIGLSVAALVGGLALVRDSGIYAAFAAGVVAAAGLYFKANVDSQAKRPDP